MPPATHTLAHTVTHSTATRTATAFARKVVTLTPHTAKTVAKTVKAVSLAHGIPMWAIYVAVGIVIASLVVLAIFVFVKKRRIGHTPSSRNLASAVTNPAADAVGVVLFLDSGVAKVLPLKKVEGMYYSMDPRETVIVIGNPYAQPFSIDGKPLVVAVASGTIGHQANVPLLTALGLSRIAVDEPMWEETANPGQAFNELIDRLLSKGGSVQGSINLGARSSLGFQMAIPRVIQALIQQHLELENVTLAQLTDWTRSMENIAKQLEARAREVMARGAMWRNIIIAVGMLIGMLAMVFILMSLLGGIHLPIPGR